MWSWASPSEFWASVGAYLPTPHSAVSPRHYVLHRVARGTATHVTRSWPTSRRSVIKFPLGSWMGAPPPPRRLRSSLRSTTTSTWREAHTRHTQPHAVACGPEVVVLGHFRLQPRVLFQITPTLCRLSCLALAHLLLQLQQVLPDTMATAVVHVITPHPTSTSMSHRARSQPVGCTQHARTAADITVPGSFHWID